MSLDGRIILEDCHLALSQILSVNGRKSILLVVVVVKAVTSLLAVPQVDEGYLISVSLKSDVVYETVVVHLERF